MSAPYLPRTGFPEFDGYSRAVREYHAAHQDLVALQLARLELANANTGLLADILTGKEPVTARMARDALLARPGQDMESLRAAVLRLLEKAQAVEEAAPAMMELIARLARTMSESN